MTERTGKRLALLLGAITVVSLAIAALLQWITRDVPVEGYGFRGSSHVFGLSVGLVGAVIAYARPQNPIGWLFAVAGAAGSVFGEFATEYAVYSLTRRRLPFTDQLAWVQNWAWVPMITTMGYFAMIFPEGHFRTRRARAVAIFGLLPTIGMAVGIATSPGDLQSLPLTYRNPYAISYSTSEAIVMVAGPLYALFLVLAVGSLIARFRRSTGVERAQLKWIVFAGSILVFGIVGNIVFGIFRTEDVLAVRLIAIITIASLTGIAVAAAIAILRYRLFDIDVVINKTLVFGAVAVLITLVYAAVVVGIGAAVGARGEPNVGLSILATAAVALVFQPARAAAHRFANRLVFGNRASPYEALSALANRIAVGVDTEHVLPTLARLMTDATAADRASVWLVVDGLLRPVAWHPDEQAAEPFRPPLDTDPVVPDAARTFPVRQDGELLGALAVWTRANDPLTDTDDKLLSDLASQAGLVLRNARLIADLRASRERLVTAQDDVRRKIERDLHDGAQQQLVALAVNLRLARQLVDADPDQGKAMLERLQQDASEALNNLRDLARGIYPPLLADRGLADALRAQADKASVEAEVQADGLPRYEQAVEAAVYFCVLEALQNVAKYAGAARARVTLGHRDGELVFTVEDDGAGFDTASATRGAGLTNMTDRIEALGGSLEVRSQPGAGTTVSGRLPARARDAS